MTHVSAPPKKLFEADDTQALFEEARHRRRRRQMWTGSALAASLVLGASAYVIAAQANGPGSGPHRSDTSTSALVRTGSTLVYGLDTLRFINADTGASRTVPMPAPGVENTLPEILRAGRFLLLNDGLKAWLYPPGVEEAPIDLGTSARIILTPSGDRVWLWGTGPANDVRLVDFTGQQIGPAVALPTDWFPTGEAVDEGLVLTPRLCPCATEIWDPTSNRVIRSFPPGMAEVAASGHVFAWEEAGCVSHCMVHLTDLQTGTQQSVVLPPRVESFGGGGAFSPDGTTLAIPGYLGPWTRISRIVERSAFTALVLVDLANRTARLLPGSEQRPTNAFGMFTPMWSDTGWLFFTEYGSRQVVAWHAGNRRATVLPNVILPRLPSPRDGQRLPSLAAT